MMRLSCLFWNIVLAIVASVMLGTLTVNSQGSDLIRCGTHRDSIPEEQKEYLKWLDEQIAEYINNMYMRGQDPSALPVITIPVVIHVLYDRPEENVPDEVLQALIDTMNKDMMWDRPEVYNKILPMFRHLIGHPRIQFCLATVDPNGNPTNGIVRVPTSTNCYSDASMKFDSPAWDPSKYMNLWIAELCGTLLGFATFPGSPSSVDGVVMDYRTLPGGAYTSFNEGRTITHEIGHWFGLYHIWGDGDCTRDDAVGDTPPSNGDQYGCPSGNDPECGHPSRMYHNYMDYSDDACLLMFTHGQALRMRAVLELDSRRAQLKYSNGCSAPGTFDVAIVGIEDQMYPAQGYVQLCDYEIQPYLTVKNIGATQSSAGTVTCSAGGETVTFNLPALNPSQQVNIAMPTMNVPEGDYQVVCEVSVSGDVVSSNNIMKYNVTTPKSCSYFEDFESAGHPSTKLYNVQISDWRDYQWVLTSRDDIIGIDSSLTTAFMYPAYWAFNNKTSMFTTPYIYISSTTTQAILSFNVAYSQYNGTSNEQLEVYVVDFCGQQLTSVWSASGANLATAPPSNYEWYPTAPSHWRQITIDLSPFKGRKIALAFKATSNNGNNIYIDNISVQTTNCQPFVSAPIATTNPSQLVSIIPSGFVWNSATTEVQIDIYELSGKHILTKKEILRKGQKIFFNDLHQGVYLLQLTDANSQRILGTYTFTVIR